MSTKVAFEEDTRESDVVFSMQSNIKSGPRVSIVIIFPEDNTHVAVLCFNYVNVDNPSKSEYILERINELNMKYTYNKFTLNDNNVVGQTFIPYDEIINPELVWALMLSLYQAMEEEYRGFMKIIWS